MRSGQLSVQLGSEVAERRTGQVYRCYGEDDIDFRQSSTGQIRHECLFACFVLVRRLHVEIGRREWREEPRFAMAVTAVVVVVIAGVESRSYCSWELGPWPPCSFLTSSSPDSFAHSTGTPFAFPLLPPHSDILPQWRRRLLLPILMEMCPWCTS